MSLARGSRFPCGHVQPTVAPAGIHGLLVVCRRITLAWRLCLEISVRCPAQGGRAALYYYCLELYVIVF